MNIYTHLHFYTYILIHILNLYTLTLLPHTQMKNILIVIGIVIFVFLVLIGTRFDETGYPPSSFLIDIKDKHLVDDIEIAYNGYGKPKGLHYLIERINNRYEVVLTRLRGGRTVFWGFTIVEHNEETYDVLEVKWKDIGQIDLSIKDIKSFQQEIRPVDSVVYILDKATFLSHLETDSSN